VGKQFYHFDPYPRVESKPKPNSKGKRTKVGTIYSIAKEAERTPGYCGHVTSPKEPVLLYGVPFSEVVKLAEQYAENTFDSCGRAVRKNGLCAIFGVVSAPPDMTEKVWTAYKKTSIQYLKNTWGKDILKSVIEHRDEFYEPDEEHGIKPGTLNRHLHFAAVPPVGVNFAEIHPGIKAKRATDKAYGVTKIPEGMDEKSFEIFKKEGRQAGDRAYRNAMRKIQDDFFNHVSNPYGLLRYGPKRLRLSREEIIKRDHEKRLRQKTAVTLDEQVEKSKEQKEKIENTQNELENIISKKQDIEENLKNREKIVSDREKKLEIREYAVNFGERKQADFEKGLKTSLKGWELPKPKVGEFAANYIKRISGEVIGIVQRALNTIKNYSQKKAELDNEKAAFEAEKMERQKQEAARTAALEKTHSENIRKLKAAYDKLKSKILGVKTSQQLASLQKELSRNQHHSIP